MKSIEDVFKRYKNHIRSIDPVFCQKVIDIIGKEEFNETCRVYLGKFNPSYKMYNFVLGAYMNKGYHLYYDFPELLDIYEEYDEYSNKERSNCLKLSGLKEEDFRNSFIEYMKPYLSKDFH